MEIVLGKEISFQIVYSTFLETYDWHISIIYQFYETRTRKMALQRFFFFFCLSAAGIPSTVNFIPKSGFSEEVQVHCTENPIYVFQEIKLCGLVPSS